MLSKIRADNPGGYITVPRISLRIHPL